LGLNPVSIEPRHKGASSGDILKANDQELNVFEGILSLKGSQPPRGLFVPVFCKIYPYPPRHVLGKYCFASLAII
jgi:hypothetical protein